LAVQPRGLSTMTVQPCRYLTLSWRTSSASGGVGECVEVAAASPFVLARDSRDRTGAVLKFNSAQWLGLLERIKNGDTALG
jgi:Domain of unknown function (DUF397)